MVCRRILRCKYRTNFTLRSDIYARVKFFKLAHRCFLSVIYLTTPPLNTTYNLVPCLPLSRNLLLLTPIVILTPS